MGCPYYEAPNPEEVLVFRPSFTCYNSYKYKLHKIVPQPLILLTYVRVTALGGLSLVVLPYPCTSLCSGFFGSFPD